MASIMVAACARPCDSSPCVIVRQATAGDDEFMNGVPLRSGDIHQHAGTVQQNGSDRMVNQIVEESERLSRSPAECGHGCRSPAIFVQNHDLE